MKLDGKIEFCVSICIRQRPDGKPPPTRRYRIGDWQPNHEQVDAFYALERDATPLPRHLSLEAKPYDYPCYDPKIIRKNRIKHWPIQAPFSYIDFALLLR